MDSLKQQVIDASITLVIDNGLKQSQLYDIIRSAFMEKVKDLPKQKILYNACYGGFGFSKEFHAYLLKEQRQQDTYQGLENIAIREYDKRQLAVPYITSFAETIIHSISETFPYFEDLLYCFQRYDLNNVFSDIEQIIKHEKDIAIMDKNVTLLREYLQNEPVIPTTPLKVSHWVVSFVKTNFTRYHPKELQRFLDEYDRGEVMNYYIQKSEQRKDNILQKLSENMFIGMKEFYTKFEEELAQEDYRLSTQDKNSFVKLVNKHGIATTQTWNHQSYYNVSAVFYLLDLYQKVDDVYPKNSVRENKLYDVFQNQFVDREETLLHTMKETFGLLCASSTYAKLKITELSALLEWDIVEYDGLERVHTV
jgi:hypothetical protein